MRFKYIIATAIWRRSDKADFYKLIRTQARPNRSKTTYGIIAQKNPNERGELGEAGVPLAQAKTAFVAIFEKEDLLSQTPHAEIALSLRRVRLQAPLHMPALLVHLRPLPSTHAQNDQNRPPRLLRKILTHPKVLRKQRQTVFRGLQNKNLCRRPEGQCHCLVLEHDRNGQDLRRFESRPRHRAHLRLYQQDRGNFENLVENYSINIEN